MTKQLEPGPELDALVAEKVFNGPIEHVDWYWWEQTMPEWPKDQPKIYAGPKFSTSIADAWEVVEKLNWLQFCIERENCSGVRWDISAYNKMDCTDRIHVTTDEAAHGICLAALTAVGYLN